MNNSIEEYNEYSYVGYDNYKNMNYVEPYNLNKPELPNINSVYNYNLREIANKLSCEHQKFKTESNKIYTTNIYNSAFTYIDDISKPLDYDYEKDIYILRGREVTPKSCDAKGKDYKKGNWINYHGSKLDKNNIIFNQNTKRKQLTEF